ncbi:MAG: aldehyde dehydrogenase family protein [Nocardioidaceae bacterium]
MEVAAVAVARTAERELGGKSPSIIFPDADLEAATAAAMQGVWGASGQVCTCSTRVLVHESVHDEVASMIVERSRDMRIGGGFDPEAQMGPLVSAEQLERVARYVQIGRDEGADLALGGARHGDRGYFHEPTVFTSVRNDMTIAREEIFGPVLAVLSYRDEDDALRIANDSPYGLGGYVFGGDRTNARRVVNGLRAGRVSYNGAATDSYTPMGGYKQSGIGRSMGRFGLEEYLEVKSVYGFEDEAQALPALFGEVTPSR